MGRSDQGGRGQQKRKGVKIDGWVVIDKPLGLTSTQVVGRVRRLTGAAKLGHGGTLDPLASGVLPIALGEATKTIPFIMEARKTYHFTVRWGQDRNTDDAEGEVVATSAHRPSPEDIEAALPAFHGVIMQRPPAFSAIKVAGQRAYDLARRGEEVTLPAREVEIFALRLLEAATEEARFEVECGKGTYVRALARDLAHSLGTCGYVSHLRRTKVGPFGLDRSISLDKLEKLVHSAPHRDWSLAVETVLDDILALAVTAGDARRLSQGQSIRVPDRRQGLVRIMHEDKLVALAELKQGLLKPVRVFNL